MQNDTISRSALVADLESFKVPMGDPVLRFLVDRVIERVKAQPGVEQAPLKIDEWDETDSRKLYDAAKAALAKVPEPERWCCECRYFELSAADAPCCYCSDQQHWEAASHENL